MLSEWPHCDLIEVLGTKKSIKCLVFKGVKLHNG